MTIFASQPGLFVYGTLHPDRAPEEIRSVVERLTWIGDGSVMGKLLDLGEYPGLVVDGSKSAVQGEVFKLDSLETLWAIDVYEGYDETDVAASLFVRKLLPVTMSGNRVEEHWAYVYHRDVAS